MPLKNLPACHSDPPGHDSSGHGFSHAEKTRHLEWALAPEVCPSAAEAARNCIDFVPLPARLKSCPDGTMQGFEIASRTERGVTLLELLVVAVLASILLAVVFPSVGAGLRTLELRSSAQRLAAAARYARDQAIHRQRFYELEIDAEARTIAVADLEGTARRAFELPASVSVEKILPEEADNGSRRRRFLFSPDGGSLAFQIILGNQRRQVAVTSDPLTGFPKVTEL